MDEKKTIPGRAGAIPAFALATTLLAGPAAALEIYTWVDENGVVHYSESRPGKPAATPVETLHIASTNSAAYDPEDYHWSILNQAERIGEQWSAIQEEKAAEEVEARTAAAEARIAELERRLSAQESADYPRPIYRPFVYLPKRHPRVAGRSHSLRPGHEPHRAPHSDRDLHVPDREPRPGWTRPESPANPPSPGFSRPGSGR